jgi:heavy metal translocating P-type ATPase
MPTRFAQRIAIGSTIAIVIHLLMLANGATSDHANIPLQFVLLLGGLPLVLKLLVNLLRHEFGSDLLAGISIVAAILMGEYLAGAIVVLMLSSGEALEAYAVRSASSVLAALAERVPLVAHRIDDDEAISHDIPLDQVAIGDRLQIYPHEVCPVDGIVLNGNGVMDEAYLTGEPYQVSKAPGSYVLSGAINGDVALTIQADKYPHDSRYAQIIQVMQRSEQQRPRLRRLGDQLGAIYTPLALALALIAWWTSGEAIRFLAVLVVATPCPLLIAIPVAVIGSISLAAKRAIVIRNPAILEKIDRCKTIIFDKTGTLTYGAPTLVAQLPLASGVDLKRVLAIAASSERYSKHPLAEAILKAAARADVPHLPVYEVSERPGQGLTAVVDGQHLRITNRSSLVKEGCPDVTCIPAISSGMECVILLDDQLAALYRFRDSARSEGASFIKHLAPLHGFTKVMLVSGDRHSEVQYLAEQVGVREVFAEQSPENKLAIVQQEQLTADTVFVGDGINDAPALVAATVGIAFGHNSDVTTEAADAVILDSSLQKVDELFHISQRMRRIALQSAVGGMAASLMGMLIAAAGYLPPVTGAVLQELIDIIAVVNALRAAWPPAALTDYDPR